ncbi:hypothetical protein C9940_05520 [Pseudidiomarina aestuarii]|uniref:Uncharacterized protein n=1 Tax=Pseudidiomarina aestuarii TaxID=624146 RepID=A0A2T4CU54_9GAMM|nr:hypothetical protein C9940_05520 [Pseudidiomarina aestuarii]
MELRCDREITAIRQFETNIAVHFILLTITLESLAAVHGDTATFVLIFENDIDNTSNGIRAILGRSTITQYFDTLDGRNRNRIQINI